MRTKRRGIGTAVIEFGAVALSLYTCTQFQMGMIFDAVFIGKNGVQNPMHILERTIDTTVFQQLFGVLENALAGIGDQTLFKCRTDFQYTLLVK